MKHRSEIQIRDPFVVVENDKYYLFGSTQKSVYGDEKEEFKVFVSDDLESFSEPITVFEETEGFWGEKDFWAPEVHKYGGKYYMFATFFGSDMRGSGILVSDKIDGKYVPHSDGAITPKGWYSLDATLWVEDGTPYAVFCHEWVQIVDGEIVLQELSEDLKRPIGEPKVLFKASDAKWSNELSLPDYTGYITDGPFIYKTKTGKLLMLWSSFKNGSYAIGIAKSENGIKGPWIQSDEPLYESDGGHGMIFKDLEGRLLLSIHAPNNTPDERAKFIELVEDGDNLIFKS